MGEASDRVTKITQRITKVELARQHAEAGRTEQALELLRKVVDAYADDPKQQERVRFLIERLESGAQI